VKFEGTRRFEAPPEVVWEVLDDPARLARVIPGVQSFEIEDDRRWHAKVKVPLRIAGLQLKIDFEKVDERPLEHAGLRAKGTGVGALMRMESSFDLAPDGTGTVMHWRADIQIAGKVGSVGQRVLSPIVKTEVDDVFDALDAEVTAAAAARV